MDKKLIKPIMGTWMTIYWEYENEMRYDHWEKACENFSAEQWRALVRDLANVGQKYIVIVNTVAKNRAIFESSVYPKVSELACDDPLEVIFSAADEYDMNIFVTNDYYISYWMDGIFTQEGIRIRNTLIDEIGTKYGHHKSFYGWYWSREAHIGPYFDQEFIDYINASSERAKKVTPNAKFLIAPYGTGNAVCDEKFVNQLKELDVDIIAYQDTVGCEVIDTEQSAKAYSILAQAHSQVPRVKLWADVETFCWEGPANVVESRLLPAPFERLKKQLEAVSPYVEETLVFIFQGLFTNPNSIAHTGYEDGAKNYETYVKWLKENHPNMIKNL